MYRSIKRQRGLGWFGLLFVFGIIAFFAIAVVKVGPLYMNHMTLVRVVKSVADDPEMGAKDAARIRTALERRWAIDYVNHVDFNDIKIKRNDRGRVLAYDYEARVNLFYNIFVIVHFQGEQAIKNSGGVDT